MKNNLTQDVKIEKFCAIIGSLLTAKKNKSIKMTYIKIKIGKIIKKCIFNNFSLMNKYL